MGTINVSRQVAEMEQVLRSRTVGVHRGEVLAALERWQWDEMLDRDSRRRARQLLREFGTSGGAAGIRPGPWGRPPSLRQPRVGDVSRPTAAARPDDQALQARRTTKPS